MIRIGYTPNLSARAWHIAQSAKHMPDKTHIVITDAPNICAHMLSFFSKTDVPELKPENAHAHDGTCVISIDTLIRHIEKPPEPFIVKIRARHTVTELNSLLIEYGYEPDPDLIEHGSMHHIGETIRFKFNTNTYVIRFDDNAIEHITLNDSPVSRISVNPAHLKPAEKGMSFGEYLASVPNAVFWDTVAYATNTLSDALKNAETVRFEHIPGNADVELNIERVPDTYRGVRNISKLKDDFSNYRYICTTTDETEWSQTVLNEPTHTHAPALQSFIDHERKTIILAEDILNIPKQKQKKRSKHSLGEIREGLLVVHKDHGIGTCTGIQMHEIGGVSREYVGIEYAKKDMLLVPVEHTDRIEKYVGAPNPPIHRLHGAEWARMVSGAKKRVQRLAGELLSLSAQRSLLTAPIIPEEMTETEKAIAESFPYDTTPDQEQTVRALFEDYASGIPTERLIAGDVGFGKTEVALRAAAHVIAHGGQVAWLAPTTVLAQQHFDVITPRLKSLEWRVCNMSRLVNKAEQKTCIEDIRSGSAQLTVGTSRLLSKDIRFKNLQLLIIDEEQRFGVKDKNILKDAKKNIHVLSLTATPIPRTLHMALSGITNISFLKTPPPGRKAIKTFVEPISDTSIREAILNELNRGGQAYYVYNDVASMNIRMNELRELIPEANIVVAHGQMHETKLMEAMHAFDTKKANVLLCSTIIENGIDLPDVNTIIIERATQFGLAQLYQLRGRVGRSEKQAYAHFLFDRQKLTGDASERLSALAELTHPGDGLEVALRDMEIRGIGNVFGSEQSGAVAFVGLGMFTALLEESVTAMQSGELPITSLSVKIQLPVSYGLPDTEPFNSWDAGYRIRTYQNLTQSETREELQKHIKSFEQDNPVPKNDERWNNMKRILEIKLLASESGIIEINRQTAPEPHIECIFEREQPLEKIHPLRALNSNWKKHGTSFTLAESEWGEKTIVDIAQESVSALHAAR